MRKHLGNNGPTNCQDKRSDNRNEEPLIVITRGMRWFSANYDFFIEAQILALTRINEWV